MHEMLEDIIKEHPGIQYSQAVSIARRIWEDMNYEQKTEYIERRKKEKYEEKNKSSIAIFIMVFNFFNKIANLNKQDLHTIYISLLAQEIQKESIQNIDKLNKEKNIYYKKYGRWYEKFISYLK